MLEAVERNVEEFLHSPNLKVFRYQPRTGKAHLYVERSDGARHPLRGQRIDDTFVAATVLATRNGDCQMCNRGAAEILRRGKT